MTTLYEKTSTLMLHSCPSTEFLSPSIPRTLHHPRNKLMSVSKGGNNIGRVWRKLYTIERCQFEVCSHHPLSIIHCNTASHTLGHPSLVSLFFTIPVFTIYLIYLSPLFSLLDSKMPIKSNINGLKLSPQTVCCHSHVIVKL